MAIVSISDGNVKMGRIPGFSLPPILSCRTGVPCAKRVPGKKLPPCYAMKSWTQYPATREAWMRNLDAVYAGKFAGKMDAILGRMRKRLFRIHPAGDFESSQYLSLWKELAERHPEKRFLAFTKQDFYFADCPDNLRIVWSAWPGWAVEPPEGLPVAYVDGLGEDRIPGDAWRCSGRCDDCGACWSLEPGEAVAFPLH